MRELSVKGIVIGYDIKNEFDRSVKLLTPNYGKIIATAKWAQKATSPFVGRLDATNICDLNIYKSTKGKFTIKQCVVKKTFQIIKKDILLFSLASAVLELMDKFAYQTHGIKKLFHLVEETLDSLQVERKSYFIYLIFKIKVLDNLGVLPSFNHCMSCQKKITTADVSFWAPENIICNDCLELENKKISGNIFDAKFLKLMKFITKESYENAMTIKIEKESIQLLESFLSEIWRSHNFPDIKSERIIASFLR